MTFRQCRRSARRQLARLLPHNNARCVAPPGRPSPGTGRPVIVPSLMRSGTHVLIDLILNNFTAYRREPLYVDLDHYLASPGAIDLLSASGSYVLKTHYPGVNYSSAALSDLQRLAEASLIVQPVRDLEEIFRSQAAWGMADRDAFAQSVSAFTSFWQRFPKLEIPFEALARPDPCREIVHTLATYLGQPTPAAIVFPPPRSAKAKVLLCKALTRLLGASSPIINTTIGFAVS